MKPSWLWHYQEALSIWLCYNVLVRFSIKSGRKTWQQHNSFRKSMGIIAERQTIWGTYVCWQLTRQAHDLFTCLCQFSFKSPHFISLTLLLRRWTVHRRPAWHQWDLTSVRWIPVEEKVNFTSFLSGKSLIYRRHSSSDKRVCDLCVWAREVLWGHVGLVMWVGSKLQIRSLANSNKAQFQYLGLDSASTDTFSLILLTWKTFVQIKS